MIDALVLAVDVAFDVAPVTRRSLLRRLGGARLRRCRFAFVVAIVLGPDELAGPNAALRSARFVLFIDVVVAVASIRDGKTRARHLGPEIDCAAAAHRDDAPVIIDVALRAR